MFLVCRFVLMMIICCVIVCFVFFFKQKTAYEMRISDWSSDVCSSDLSLRDWDQYKCAENWLPAGIRPPTVAPATAHRHRCLHRNAKPTPADSFGNRRGR